MEKAFESLSEFSSNSEPALNGMNFVSTIKERADISVYNYEKEIKEDDVDHIGGNIRVYWTLNIEARNWGIKSISVDVTRVEGILSFESYKESPEILPDYKLDTDESKWQIIVDNVDDTTFGSNLSPDTIDFDFSNNQIVVNF